MNNLPKEVQQAHELIDDTLKLLEKENTRIAETNMEFKEENLENLNREITQFKKMKENRYLNEIKEQMELENIDFNDNETSKNKSFFLKKMKNFFKKNDQKNKELER
ncbi:hypothetical protein QDG00_001609 [Campylobacter jejuni]|nr:hypothetical protein [Campylobacter jejuni]ELQ3352851.1 hypothetical protein [Campylobacter jejuni]